MAEEEGRCSGGRRNVEASIIASANERASSKEQGRTEKQELQEARLIAYAKNEGIWRDSKLFTEDEMIAEGAEAKIFPSPNSGYLLKVVNYKRYSKTPLEYLDNRITLHNYLFPDTVYTLVGLTETEDFTGNRVFAFIVEQAFVTGRYINFSKNREAI